MAKNFLKASISESNRFWKKINDQNKTRGKGNMFINCLGCCNSQWTCWVLQFLNRYDPESKEISTLELQLQWKHWHVSLCSTKFQNVKLRMTLLKFDNFTATPILCEIKFLQIRMVQKCYFGNFEGSEFWFLVNLSNFQDPNLLKNQNSEPLKEPKMTFLDRLNSPKFDFT